MSGVPCQEHSRPDLHETKLLQSLARGLNVLEVFRHDEELTLHQLTARTKFAKTTVFRILQTLERLGYVDSTPVGKFRLGIRILNIGRDGRTKHLLRRSARPHLQQLVARFGETVNLGVLDGLEVLYLEVLESPASLRVVEKPGSHSTLHTSAMGKCLISGLPDLELHRILGSLKMQRFTDRTLTAPEQMAEQIKIVRVTGLAVDAEESVVHASCLAVPVWDETGAVPAALSITGPTSRLFGIGIETIIAELVRTGDAITQDLGGRTGLHRPPLGQLTGYVLSMFRHPRMPFSLPG